MTLVLQQLVARLQSRYPGSYVASIGQNHLQLVQSQIEAHFVSRQRVKRITVSILHAHTACVSCFWTVSRPLLNDDRRHDQLVHFRFIILTPVRFFTFF